MKHFSFAIFLISAAISSVAQTSVEYLTGSANVNLPIYTLRAQDLDIPVSINYKTSGIRVNDVASWIGLGWNLSAGGMVTRELHGLPDEARTLNGSTVKGYLRANDLAVQQNFIGPWSGQTASSSPSPKTYNLPYAPSDADQSEMRRGKIDLEPDIFHVTAPGLNVKFLFGVETRKRPHNVAGQYYVLDDTDPDPILTIPEQNLSITYVRSENEIISFNIISLDGTTYTFDHLQHAGNGMETINENIPGFEAGYVNAWMLTSIVSANHINEASFTYTDGASPVYLNFYEELKTVYSEGVVNNGGDTDDSPDPYQGPSTCEFNNPMKRNKHISYVYPCHLNTIVTTGGTLTFIQGEERQDYPGEHLLDKIEFTSADGYYMGKCDFQYDYFISDASSYGYQPYSQPQDFKRLRLLSMAFHGSNNLPIGDPTLFNYYSEATMPARNGYQQDHWGYSNMSYSPSNNTNEDLTPLYNFNEQTDFIDIGYGICITNREPLLDGAIACTLSNIKSPDGATQYFEYELNTYSTYETQPVQPFQDASGIEQADVEYTLFLTCSADTYIYDEESEFDVEWDHDVLVQYSQHIWDVGLNDDCDEVYSHLWKEIQILNSDDIVIFNRVIPNDDNLWSGEELKWLSTGSYTLRVRTTYGGRINMAVEVHATITTIYEPAPFWPVMHSRYGGGLRVHKLITDSGADNLMVTRIEYGETTDDPYEPRVAASEGVLLTMPRYASTWYDNISNITQIVHHEPIVGTVNTGDTYNNCNCNYTMRSSVPINPLQAYNGSSVLYKKVTVFSDDYGQAHGYTIYHYSITDIPSTAFFQSGINLLEDGNNNALRAVETYTADNRLESKKIFYYDHGYLSSIYGAQVKTNGQYGTINRDATGIDHNALRKELIISGFSCAAAAASICLAAGPAGLVVAVASAVINTFNFIHLALLANTNDPPSLIIINDQSHIDLGLSNYRYKRYKNTPSVIETREYDIDNPLTDATLPGFNPNDASLYRSVSHIVTTYNTDLLPKQYETDYNNSIAPYGRVMHYKRYTTELFASSYSAQVLASPMGQAVQAMQERGIRNKVFEDISVVESDDGLMVIDATLQTYQVFNARVVPYRLFRIELPRPILISAFMSIPLNLNGGALDGLYADKTTIWKHISTNVAFDPKGRILANQQEKGIVHSVIRDYADGRVVAAMENAMPDKCGYTSFETSTQSSFTYTTSAIASDGEMFNSINMPKAKTGHKYYLLQTATNITATAQPGTSVLSFWIRGAVPLLGNATGLTKTLVLQDEPDPRTWTYLEYKIVNSNSSTVTYTISAASGQNILIDEIRTYPEKALMATACYNPDGTTHTECDINNFCSYRGYHDDRKPWWIMDHNYRMQATRAEKVYDHPSGNQLPNETYRIMTDGQTNFAQATNASLNNEAVITYNVFMDGLRRPLQTQGYKTSPDQKDMISFNEYDDQGRTTRQYLPYVHNYELQKYVPTYLEDQADFYHLEPQIAHTDFPFSDIVLSSTPKATPVEIGHVGEAWQLGEHTTIVHQSFNSDDEVILFTVKDNYYSATVGVAGVNTAETYNSLVSGTYSNSIIRYWQAGLLRKVMVKDENNKETYKYYDPMGRLIMSRTPVWSYEYNGRIVTTDLTMGQGADVLNYNNTGAYRNFDTYYVYDMQGHMRFEISPDMTNALIATGHVQFSTDVNGINYSTYFQLGYANFFNRRDDLVEIHSPGVDNTFIVYDELHRPVLSQDARQRLNNQWAFLRYDELGRTVYNGILNATMSRLVACQWFYDQPVGEGPYGFGNTTNFTLFESRSTASGALYGYTNSIPRISAPAFFTTGVTALHVSYFNDYDFDLAGLAYSGSAPLAKRIRDVATGSLSKVIDSSPELMLTYVSYYDQDAHILSEQHTTLLGGSEKYDYSINWRGVLTSVDRKHNSGTSGYAINLRYRYEYDRMGRLLHSYQKTGDDPEVMIKGLEYNAIGQQIRKHLHLPQGQNTGMQVVDYRYNERGWLTKINNSNLSDDGDNLEDYDVFGLELNYNNQDNEQMAKYGGTALAPYGLYNGIISSITFNTKDPTEDGTTLQEKTYVYRYDDLYRLTCSAFGAEDLSFGSYGSFSRCNNGFMEKTDYDISGNILKMKRERAKGLWVNDHSTVDNLTYDYSLHTHRLMRVTDAIPSGPVEEYTQFTEPQQVGADYAYDAIGNCISDANKKIQYAFNVLGLMGSATYVGSGDACEFTYDATGERLSKKIGSKVTYYFDGIEYYFDGTSYSLVQIATEEGIVRPKHDESNSTEYIYDYYLKDHLGNVRAIITEGDALDMVEVATMELDNSTAEETEFEYLSYSRSAVSLGYPSGDDTGTQISALSPATTLQGPSRLIPVIASDQLQVTVQSWYPSAASAMAVLTVSQIAQNIIAGVLTQGTGTLQEATLNAFATNQAGNSSVLYTLVDNALAPYNINTVQGYLIYISLDNDLNIISGDAIPVEDPDVLTTLQTQQLTIPQDGYFFTYLTNYSDHLVTFDNLTLHHKQGNVRARFDYYTYGLPWWDQRGETETPYNETMQGTEFQQDEWSNIAGLDLNYFEARYYDPVLGRWHSPDPMEQFHSPYLAMADNPANFTDPDGRFALMECGAYGASQSELSAMATSNTAGAGGSAGAGLGMGLGIASLYFGLSQAFNGVNMGSTTGQKLSLISNGVGPNSGGNGSASAIGNMDGNYYSPSGEKLGSIGDSDEIKVVNDRSVWDNYSDNPNSTDALDALSKNSVTAYKEENLTQMLKEWGEEMHPKSKHQESAMMIYQKVLTNDNNDSFRVLIKGTTVSDGALDEVNPENSSLKIGGQQIAGKVAHGTWSNYESKSGWEYYVAIHTHPTGGKERQNFSTEDYGWSLEKNVPLFMVPYDNKILYKFDPDIYNKSTRHKFTPAYMYGDASFDSDALINATKTYNIFSK